jgi:hypothetical protein
LERDPTPYTVHQESFRRYFDCRKLCVLVLERLRQAAQQLGRTFLGAGLVG